MYPQQYSSQQAYGGAATLTGVAKLAFLRRVYGLFTTSIFAASAGALFALYAGTGSSATTLTLADGTVRTVPPLVALLSGGWLVYIVGFAVMFGAFMGASAVRKKPVVNWIALHGATFISGVYIAPAIFASLLMASQGQTLAVSPVRDAFVLASVGFVGLSSFTIVSKKDFSFLGGFLAMGFFVVLGGLVIGMFFQSNVFQLAVASAGVLLFGGFILYDTSRILREGNDDPVGAAIRLYLDFFNLFIMLLSILSSRRD